MGELFFRQWAKLKDVIDLKIVFIASFPHRRETIFGLHGCPIKVLGHDEKGTFSCSFVSQWLVSILTQMGMTDKYRKIGETTVYICIIDKSFIKNLNLQSFSKEDEWVFLTG